MTAIRRVSIVGQTDMWFELFIADLLIAIGSVILGPFEPGQSAQPTV